MARKKEKKDVKRGREQMSQQPQNGQQGYYPYQQAGNYQQGYRQNGQQNYQQGYQQQMNGQQNYQQGYQQMNGQQNYQQGYQQMNGQQNYQQGYQQQMGGQQNYQQGYQQMGGQQNYQQRYQQPGYQQVYQGYQQPYDHGMQEAAAAAAKKKKRRRTRKVILFIVEIIVLLLLAAALYVGATLSKMKTETLENEEEIVQQVKEQLSEPVVQKLSGYWNIALYGVDSREGNTESSTRTDTIMVASINKETKEVKLVSVYRDTYLDNTDGHYRKATECYENGGPSKSINMLNRNLDLDITNYVAVDMNVVAEVVDLIGGIEIDVQPDEIQWINGYQEEGSVITGKQIVPVYDAGPQVLNGLQAMSYCRIRYTDGADYKRTERQRDVLGKILEKVQSLDLLTLTGMIDDLLPYISTNLTKTEILNLATGVASYKISETTGFPFTKVSLESLGYIIAPATLESNVIQLHEFLFGETYTPSQTVKEISDYIINYTGVTQE